MHTFSIIFLIFSAVFLLVFLVKKVHLKNYCKQNGGKIFLVLSKRHGWFQFYQNNMRKVIPDMVCVLWLDSESEGKEHRIMLPSASNNLKAPYFAFVENSKIRTRSLHEELIVLRRNQMSSDEIQKGIRNIFQTILRDG